MTITIEQSIFADHMDYMDSRSYGFAKLPVDWQAELKNFQS